MSVPEVLSSLLLGFLISVYFLTCLLLVSHSRLRVTPLPIFAGFWMGFYLLYILGVGVPGFGGVYMIGLLMLINISVWFGHRLSVSERQRSLIESHLLWPRLIIFMTVLLGIAVNAFLITKSGVELVRPSSLLALPDWYSSQRYQEGAGIPFPARVANSLTFAGTMISAVIFAESWHRRKSVAWIALLPGMNCIIYGIIIGSKAPIIYAVIYYLNGYFITCLYHGIRINLAWLFIGVALLLSSAVTLAITAQYLRATGNQSVPFIIETIATSYFIVPPTLLIQWLDVSYIEIGSQLNPGIKTFQGISSYFLNDIGGSGEMGYVTLFGKEYHSSVYTAFRWIITDFGLIVAPLVTAAAAFAFGRSAKRIQCGHIFGLGIFFFLGNMLLFSFAGTPYKYTSHVVSIACLFIYLGLSAMTRLARLKQGNQLWPKSGL